MKLFRRILFLAITVGFSGAVSAAMADEAPDVMVKRVSTEVVGAVKADKAIQSGNRNHVLDLVRKDILPYVDFQRMT